MKERENSTTDSMDSETPNDEDIDLNEYVSEESLEHVVRFIDIDMEIAPFIIPPIPLEEVSEVAGDTEYSGRLYGLADICKAFNYAVSPVMAYFEEYDEENKVWIDYEEAQYDVSDQSVTEVGIAASLLLGSYERELLLIASDLGVDDREEYERESGYDYTEAVRDYFDYVPEYDFEKPIREIADETDSSPSEVYNVLFEYFGEDVEHLKCNDPEDIDFASLDDLRELMKDEEN